MQAYVIVIFGEKVSLRGLYPQLNKNPVKLYLSPISFNRWIPVTPDSGFLRARLNSWDFEMISLVCYLSYGL